MMIDSAIQLVETSGTQHLQNAFETFHCSGVIPYCLYGNACYFLLGKTRTGKLLTYTGKSELDRERAGFFEPPVVTAAREFFEESLGSIISYAQCLEACKACDKRKVIVSATPKNTVCYTFLIEVAYRRHYSSVFLKVKSFLEFMKLNAHHLNEFCEIKGVCFDTLNSKIRYAWWSSGMITSDAEWLKIQDIALGANATTPRSVATSSTLRNGGNFEEGGGRRRYSNISNISASGGGCGSVDWRLRSEAAVPDHAESESEDNAATNTTNNLPSQSQSQSLGLVPAGAF